MISRPRCCWHRCGLLTCTFTTCIGASNPVASERFTSCGGKPRHPGRGRHTGAFFALRHVFRNIVVHTIAHRRGGTVRAFA